MSLKYLITEGKHFITFIALMFLSSHMNRLNMEFETTDCSQFLVTYLANKGVIIFRMLFFNVPFHPKREKCLVRTLSALNDLETWHHNVVFFEFMVDHEAKLFKLAVVWNLDIKRTITCLLK